MEIVKLNINDLKKYEGNAKLHPKEQIEQIKKSIEEFGMNDPIAIWGEENIIVEGHGRLEACKQLGFDEVECIRLDHLTDEERRAYTLAHNKLTMNSDFDEATLDEELAKILEINMADFGFLDAEEEQLDNAEDKYTTKINIPQYEIKGEMPLIQDLYDEFKANKLIDEIDANEEITDEQKNFLKKAACRLYVFNYAKIAEYYAHQDKAMQEMMEKLALVIIDIDNAIANGYVELSEELEAMLTNE